VGDKALTKEDVSALQLLETVKMVQDVWVGGGKNEHLCTDPTLSHNVSNTIHITKDSEWDECKEFIWENRHSFSGISFAPENLDQVYEQAPFEAVKDNEKWDEIMGNYQEIDYEKDLIEEEDNTTISDTVACSGGSCEIL
jgi:ribonucleoside-diphosphate reductase alpha chain